MANSPYFILTNPIINKRLTTGPGTHCAWSFFLCVFGLFLLKNGQKLHQNGLLVKNLVFDLHFSSKVWVLIIKQLRVQSVISVFSVVFFKLFYIFIPASTFQFFQETKIIYTKYTFFTFDR